VAPSAPTIPLDLPGEHEGLGPPLGCVFATNSAKGYKIILDRFTVILANILKNSGAPWTWINAGVKRHLVGLLDFKGGLNFLAERTIGRNLA
jgi:hypothetical protein